MQESSQFKNYFEPFKLKKCQNQSPDMPEFKKHKVNVFIMTKNGRPVFARYGNQIKCSSFLATFSAITGKITKFYSDNPDTETMHKINHGLMTLYLIKRKNINILCISKSNHDELKILSTLDFVNMQLISSLTDNLNILLGQKQGYDPTTSFNPTIVNLLSSSIKNGLSSPCILLNSIPVLPLPSQQRGQVFSMMKQVKMESMLVFVLMTMTQVVSILRKKEIDLHAQDVLLLFNILHTQKSLRTSMNWFPICVPGIDETGYLFCYSNFITQHLVVVMLSDQREDVQAFHDCANKFAKKINESEVNKTINKILSKPQILQLKIDKIQYLEHFIIKNTALNQLILSQGNYFGQNSQKFKNAINKYSKIHRTRLLLNNTKKQLIHYQSDKDGAICQFVHNDYTIFFVGRQIMSLEISKVILDGLCKWLKNEEDNIFIFKDC